MTKLCPAVSCSICSDPSWSHCNDIVIVPWNGTRAICHCYAWLCPSGPVVMRRKCHNVSQRVNTSWGQRPGDFFTGPRLPDDSGNHAASALRPQHPNACANLCYRPCHSCHTCLPSFMESLSINLKSKFSSKWFFHTAPFLITSNFGTLGASHVVSHSLTASQLHGSFMAS